MLQWMRKGGRPERGDWRLRFQIGWQTFWFERNLALQHRLPAVVFSGASPVFVLGLWRSGSTFLHELMGACPGMVFPATWQCMSPASFRFRSPPVAHGAVIRPMDGFAISAFSPQEDEFALLALGVPSLYRAFFDPRRLAELAYWLKPESWVVDSPKGWMGVWREFLGGVVDGKAGRLLLKSPGHTFRIQALVEAFPDASYVWLVRDPAELFLSNRKMWSSMFGRYALWNWSLPALDMFLQEAFVSAARCLDYATSALPQNRLAVVEFTQLVGNPAATTDALSVRLDLGDRELYKRSAEATASEKAGYRADTYDGKTLPPVASAGLEKLCVAQRAAISSHGV